MLMTISIKEEFKTHRVFVVLQDFQVRVHLFAGVRLLCQLLLLLHDLAAQTVFAHFKLQDVLLTTCNILNTHFKD